MIFWLIGRYVPGNVSEADVQIMVSERLLMGNLELRAVAQVWKSALVARLRHPSHA